MWLAIQTRPRAENMAAILLEHKGYEVFFPKQPLATRSRTRLLETPLFPGYLFCRAVMCPRAHGLIVTTPGVRGIVSFNKQPVTVSETEISNIKLLMNSKLPVYRWPNVEVGDEIELICGPLAGCRGTITQRGEEHHFIVSIEILRRSIAVKVDTEWIRPLPKNRPSSPVMVAKIANAG
jgi:transcription termination/antitermination protein NusG